jgi:hypothetical protein
LPLQQAWHVRDVAFCGQPPHYQEPAARPLVPAYRTGARLPQHSADVKDAQCGSDCTAPPSVGPHRLGGTGEAIRCGQHGRVALWRPSWPPPRSNRAACGSFLPLDSAAQAAGVGSSAGVPSGGFSPTPLPGSRVRWAAYGAVRRTWRVSRSTACSRSVTSVPAVGAIGACLGAPIERR